MKKISRLKKIAEINDNQLYEIANLITTKKCDGDNEEVYIYSIIPINKLPEGITAEEFIEEYNSDKENRDYFINDIIADDARYGVNNDDDRDFSLKPVDQSIGINGNEIYIEVFFNVIWDNDEYEDEYEDQNAELLREYHKSVL
jgi:hypothetical protein